MKRATRSRVWSPPRSAFAGFRFPAEVIVVAVRWYLRYGLSYRDVEELLAERGVEVDHVTVYRWVQRFTPQLADAARFARRSPGDRWFVDETYVKVNGVWRYVLPGHRAVRPKSLPSCSRPAGTALVQTAPPRCSSPPATTLDRMRSEASFAALGGVSPIEVSSGNRPTPPQPRRATRAAACHRSPSELPPSLPAMPKAMPRRPKLF